MGSLSNGESALVPASHPGIARKRARGVSINIPEHLKKDAEPYLILEGKIVPYVAYG